VSADHWLGTGIVTVLWLLVVTALWWRERSR
jgi:hypothetical protein